MNVEKIEKLINYWMEGSKEDCDTMNLLERIDPEI
jgi:hypothetical protein